METPFAASVVAVIALSVCALFFGVNASTASGNLLTGNVVAEPHVIRLDCAGLDISPLDLNRDARVDHYDTIDLLNGLSCTDGRCDLNDDGAVTADDITILHKSIVALYDYDGDKSLTRSDLRTIHDGHATCSAHHLYDLTGDGRVDAQDRSAYLALIYNHDLPLIDGVTA